MMALDYAVRSGRALYAGISNYQAEQARQAAQRLRQLGTPCLIHQPSYNMFNRWIEEGLLETLAVEGMGCIPFSPLAQGLLTGKYLGGIPEDSRAAKPHGALKADRITEERLAQVRQLDEIAQQRGQSLAQMALAWVLRHPVVTSALVGASRPHQLEDSVAALKNLEFSAEELMRIEEILAG